MTTVAETDRRRARRPRRAPGVGRRRRRAQPGHRRDPARGPHRVDRRAPRGGRRVRRQRPGAARPATLGVCMGTVGPGLDPPAQRPLRRQEVARAGAGDLRPGAARRDRQRLLPGGRQRRGCSATWRCSAAPITSADAAARGCSSRPSTRALDGAGVAVLTLPGDVGGLDVPKGTPAPHVRRTPAPAVPRAPAPSRRRPPTRSTAPSTVTLLVGHAARATRATEVLALAERLAAPMVLTLKAKEGLEHDNPYAGRADAA